MTEAQMKNLHNLCREHKEIVLASRVSGCFHCKTSFNPTRIVEWVGSEASTALCPNCKINAVLPGTWSDVVLEEMHNFYFG